MAVTSIWPIKGKISKVINYARNPEKTTQAFSLDQASLHAIDGVVEYAANDLKTEERSYVSCIRCTEDNAAQQFMETKKYWQYEKGQQVLGGRVCFHGYQSFAAGEVTAEIAHQIGKKLAQRLWGDDFEVVIATHCNTGHYHNHIIVNSVSWRDGHRFHNGPDDYRQMREESDRLCLEYGLSVIESPQGNGKNYGEWLAEQNGKPTVRSLIREDIDRAIAASLTYSEFFSQLEDMGYELNLIGSTGMPLKHPGLKPAGADHFFRFYKLGPGYDLESIGDRLLDHNRRTPPFSEDEIREARRYRREHRPKVKLHGFRALCIRYCFELGVIRRYPASTKRVSSFMKEDLARFEKLDEMTQFVARYEIDTIDDLNRFREIALKEIESLQAQRQQLRNKVKREARAGSLAADTRCEITVITKKINTKRHELKLADDVEGRSVRMARELEAMGVWQENEFGKEERDELFIGLGRTGRENDTGRN